MTIRRFDLRFDSNSNRSRRFDSRFDSNRYFRFAGIYYHHHHDYILQWRPLHENTITPVSKGVDVVRRPATTLNGHFSVDCLSANILNIVHAAVVAYARNVKWLMALEFEVVAEAILETQCVKVFVHESQ